MDDPTRLRALLGELLWSTPAAALALVAVVAAARSPDGARPDALALAVVAALGMLVSTVAVLLAAAHDGRARVAGVTVGASWLCWALAAAVTLHTHPPSRSGSFGYHLLVTVYFGYAALFALVAVGAFAAAAAARRARERDDDPR